jgi:hypothetical protein
LAPDEKMYIICGNGKKDIHRINSPDLLGLACDVQQHSVHLTAYNAFTIPGNVNYFLAAEGGTICDSLLTSQKDLIIFNKDKLFLFPNPCNNKLMLFLPDAFKDKTTITVYDETGRLLFIQHVSRVYKGFEVGSFVKKISVHSSFYNPQIFKFVIFKSTLVQLQHLRSPY